MVDSFLPLPVLCWLFRLEKQSAWLSVFPFATVECGWYGTVLVSSDGSELQGLLCLVTSYATKAKMTSFSIKKLGRPDGARQYGMA
jgi:hypothetical protein